MEVVDNNSSADLLDLNETLSLEEDEERKLLLKINSSFGAWLVFMEMSLALIGKFLKILGVNIQVFANLTLINYKCFGSISVFGPLPSKSDFVQFILIFYFDRVCKFYQKPRSIRSKLCSGSTTAFGPSKPYDNLYHFWWENQIF